MQNNLGRRHAALLWKWGLLHPAVFLLFHSPDSANVPVRYYYSNFPCGETEAQGGDSVAEPSSKPVHPLRPPRGTHRAAPQSAAVP